MQKIIQMDRSTRLRQLFKRYADGANLLGVSLILSHYEMSYEYVITGVSSNKTREYRISELPLITAKGSWEYASRLVHNAVLNIVAALAQRELSPECEFCRYRYELLTGSCNYACTKIENELMSAVKKAEDVKKHVASTTKEY